VLITAGPTYEPIDPVRFIGNRSSNPQPINLSNTKINIQVINYRLSPKSKISKHLFWIFMLAILQKIIPEKSIKQKLVNFNDFLKNLNKVDIVGNINGGDSFSDIYGIRRFVIGSIPSIISILLGKRFILFPQTYGPFKSKISESIAIYLITSSYAVYSRDHECIDYIKKIVKSKDTMHKIKFCPDVAFLLDSIKPKRILTLPPLNSSTSVIVGININGLMYEGGYTGNNMFSLKTNYKKLTSNIIEKLIDDNKNLRILLIPHTYGKTENRDNDTSACKEILESLDRRYIDKIHIVLHEYDQSELKGIIGMCDFFIGSRMHACIAALSQGVPTVGIAYSKKFIGVFDSIDSGDLVADARNLNETEILEIVMDTFKNRSFISNAVKIKIVPIKNLIISNFKEL
jgi:polysaccharide pyruvyl transferase WcaK-like protein